jgi:hypothetical protein
VVVVGGIALAGGFGGGGGGHAGPSGQSIGAASATTRPAGTNGGSGLGSATKEPTAHPTHSASGPQPSGAGAGSERGTLCRQYWAFFAHPESQASWAAEKDNLQQLSQLAGSPWNVNRYCMAYYQWGFAPPAAGTNPGNDEGGPGRSDPGNSPGSKLTPHSADKAGNGGGGNGNGKGKGPHGNGHGVGNDNQQ